MDLVDISSTDPQKLTQPVHEKGAKFKPNVTFKVARRGGTKPARLGQ